VFGEDGGIVESFRAALHPYHILAASLIPLGPCRYSFTALSSSEKLERHGGPLMAVHDDAVSAGLLYVLVPLVVIAVTMVVLVAACAPLVFRRRHRAKQAAIGGKPGVPVIFADEVDGRRRTGIEEDTDDDDPVAAVPPLYSAVSTAGADYKLLLVASSDNDDDDDELSRQHERHSQSDSLRQHASANDS